MPPALHRLAYVAEFLLALIAIWTLWSQVGGQGHLDLMPWYDKLSLSVALALVTVLGTMSATEHERAWNARTLALFLMALLIAGAMAALTYYYHVHEDDEDGDGDANVATITLEVPLPYPGNGQTRRGFVSRRVIKMSIPSRARQPAVSGLFPQPPVEPRA